MSRHTLSSRSGIGEGGAPDDGGAIGGDRNTLGGSVIGGLGCRNTGKTCPVGSGGQSGIGGELDGGGHGGGDGL